MDLVGGSAHDYKGYRQMQHRRSIKWRKVLTDPYPQLNETRMSYDHVPFYRVPQLTTQCP